MGLIKLIKHGVFSALFDFSVPAVSIMLWAGFLVGIAVQTVLNKRAKTPERRFIFAAAAVVLILICEFTQYGRLLPDNQYVIYAYALLLCVLVGLAIPAVVLWIRNKKAAAKSATPQKRPNDE